MCRFPGAGPFSVRGTAYSAPLDQAGARAHNKAHTTCTNHNAEAPVRAWVGGWGARPPPSLPQCGRFFGMDAWFEAEVGRHDVSVWIFYRGIW